MNETEQPDAEPESEGVVPEVPVATPAQTRSTFTKLSARGYTQLRHILVQLPDGKERGSTVGKMVGGRKHRALLLYVLILTCWPWLKDRKFPLPADAWLRALASKDGLTWSNSTLSRALADLQEMGLIERQRVGRSVRIVPRREDGGDAYTAPEGRTDRYNTYFTLPDSFWNDELFAKLNLPGLAMLLVIAKETSKEPEMYIPHEYGQAWYGLKPGTIKNGIKELRDLEMLNERMEWRTAPLSAIGRAPRIWYSLRADFSQEARQLVRETSQAERLNRLKSRSKAAAMDPATA
jgi:DNA-binding transcriptional ArsR family regulator